MDINKPASVIFRLPDIWIYNMKIILYLRVSIFISK